MDYKQKIKDTLNNINNLTYLEYLNKELKKYKYICVFGAGNIGKGTVEELQKHGINVDFLCDNDKSKVGNLYNGKPCISLDELIEKKDETVVIISTRYYKEIYNQLIRLGINNIKRIFVNKFYIDDYIYNKDIQHIKDKLIEVIDNLEDEESKRIFSRIIEEWVTHKNEYGQLDDIYTDNQYFPEDIVKLSENEVFVDGGAYIGDTAHEFLKKCNYKFNELFLFELNKNNYERLLINVEEYDNEIRSKIKVFNLGVSDKEKEVYYSDADEGSSISEFGKVTSGVINIDKFFKNNKVTFIKMDIEGEELKALEGAKHTIKTYRPKLSICLYHKPQDLWEIPLFIKNIDSNYKIFIRHHTDLLNETVCYAIPK